MRSEEKEESRLTGDEQTGCSVLAFFGGGGLHDALRKYPKLSTV